MRISVALLGVWPVCCRSSFPMNTVLFCWSFPHLLPIISVVCPDLFINCCPAHTSLPHSGLNLIPTASLSPWIESLGRPWVGLFSRGDLRVQRGAWKAAGRDQFLATQLHKEPSHASDGTAVQGCRDVSRWAADRTAHGDRALTPATDLVLPLQNAVQSYHYQLTKLEAPAGPRHFT